MKKLIIVCVSLLLFAVPLTACSSKEGPEKQQTVSQTIAVQDSSYLEGMNLATQKQIQHNQTDVTISLYTDAALDSSGKPMLDDRQEWALVAETGGKVYPLLERKQLQLGDIHFAAVSDMDSGALHILVTVTTSASVSAYDCVYQDKGFIKAAVYELEDVNLLSMA